MKTNTMNTNTIKPKSVCPTIIYTIGSHAIEERDETKKLGRPFKLPDNCQVIFYSEKNYCIQINDELIDDIGINAPTYRDSIHEIYSNKDTYRKSCNPSIDKVIHRIKFNYGPVPNYELSIDDKTGFRSRVDCWGDTRNPTRRSKIVFDMDPQEDPTNTVYGLSFFVKKINKHCIKNYGPNAVAEIHCFFCRVTSDQDVMNAPSTDLDKNERGLYKTIHYKPVEQMTMNNDTPTPSEERPASPTIDCISNPEMCNTNPLLNIIKKTFGIRSRPKTYKSARKSLRKTVKNGGKQKTIKQKTIKRINSKQ